jgi:DNA-binding response OmpR family regulator
MAATAAAAKTAGAGYTVLVVDDDPRIVELLHIALGAHGYRVLSAGNGEDALRMALEEQPDLVILDVRLPRRSGYEVCESIRREPGTAHLPVIMVSALGETEARLQGLARGADDYLPKPFSPKELIAKVRRALARSEEMKSLARRTRELAGELERTREDARRAQDELRRERTVRESVDRLAQELSRLHRTEDVASSFLLALLAPLGVQSATVLLADSTAPDRLEPRIVRGLDAARTRALSVAADGDLLQLLTALGRPVRREELERFPHLAGELDPLVISGTALLVPLVSRGRLVALALLGEKAGAGAFSGLDLELTASLAQTAAVAVEQTGVLRHAEQMYARAMRAYGMVVDQRRPGALARAERIGDVAEGLARELGIEGVGALSLRLEALAHGVEDERPPGTDGDGPARSGLEQEILAVAIEYVDLAGRLDAGTPPRQIVAHLKGDRHVLGALEEWLVRGASAARAGGS